ncbi:hypothetical protein CASFOL_003349 [Castilleja foliolosa]|uniref:CCHC-type domain-containing protein n=1 Tax=Castilleja foliolosa TaxID=1961234 RepID=A0ABD3EGW7_9LAMI
MATNIGNFVGSFVKADLSTSAHKWRKSLRIQVDIDISKPLTTVMLIGSNGRKKILLEIRYERLTDICYKCGKIGHKATNCPDNLEFSDESTPNPKYGPWMKAENSHIQHPKYQVHIPASEREVMDTNEKEMEENKLILAKNLDPIFMSVDGEGKSTAGKSLSDGGGGATTVEEGAVPKAAETAADELTETSDKMDICQKIALKRATNGRDEILQDICEGTNDLKVENGPRAPSCELAITCANNKEMGKQIGPGLDIGPLNHSCKKGPAHSNTDNNHGTGFSSHNHIATKSLNLIQSPNIHLSKKLKFEPAIREKEKVIDKEEDGSDFEQTDSEWIDTGKAQGKTERAHIYSITRENANSPKLHKIEGNKQTGNTINEVAPSLAIEGNDHNFNGLNETFDSLVLDEVKSFEDQWR